MYSLRPHTKIDFVRLWKYGFRLSGVLIALAIVGFIVSTVLTGAPLTLGTEFSGGTSIQINDAGDVTEDEIKDAFATAASELGYETQISSIQTAASMSGGNGYIVKTTDTVSTNASEIMGHVEQTLGLDEGTVEIETIGASWGASVIWSSILAFFLSCLGILAVIAIRYREPRMGVVALICLFHDMIVVLGIYAWAGLFFHMEITSDVIAALLAIIGYSLYDTVVVFHRISKNASPQMKCSLLTCANRSLNEVIVRTINTSITSVIPVVFMLIIGTDTLVDFAFAMFCGMVVGVYSTLAISAPIYTKWKAKEPAYARLENKYPYEVVQSPFTKQMMIEARKETATKLKVEKEERAKLKQEEREAAAKIKQEEKEAQREAARGEHDIAKTTKRKADQAHEDLKQAEKDAEAALDEEFAPDRLAVEAEEAEAAETPAEKATGADDEKQPATSTGVESQVDAAQDAPVEAVEEIDEEIVPAEAARPDEETEVEVGEEIAEQSEEPTEESERASGVATRPRNAPIKMTMSSRRRASRMDTPRMQTMQTKGRTVGTNGS